MINMRAQIFSLTSIVKEELSKILNPHLCGVKYSGQFFFTRDQTKSWSPNVQHIVSLSEEFIDRLFLMFRSSIALGPGGYYAYWKQLRSAIIIPCLHNYNLYTSDK